MSDIDFETLRSNKAIPCRRQVNGGVSKYLGSFTTVEQAKAVFDAAWRETYGDPQT